MDLDRVTTLTSKQRAYLRKAGFTDSHEVLCTPTAALQRRTGLPPDEVDACVRAVAEFRLPTCTTVAAALKKNTPRRFSAGAGDAFDAVLGGGIRAGSVTEIVGESATGKSNLCMQLALQAQLPVELGGLVASALYLTSETSQSAFPSNRLLELARALRSKVPDDRVPSEADLLANVHLGNAAALEPLELIIAHHAPALAVELLKKGRPRLGLIVVDSLAAPTRADFATNTLSGLSDRAKALAVLGDKLKQIAHELDLAVVVVNQVSDVFVEAFSLPSTPVEATFGGPTTPLLAEGDDAELQLSYDSQARFFSGQAPDLGKQAALGLVWANAVGTRVMLSHTGRKRGAKRTEAAEDAQEEEGDARPNIRKASLVFSPFAPPSSVDYIIEEGGLQAVSERYHINERWPSSRRSKRPATQSQKDLLPSDEDDWAALASEDLQLVP